MTPSYRSVLVSQGVTHHWPLDEVSGSTSYASSGSLNLTIQGSGMVGAQGAVGSAMYFGGPSSDQYLYSTSTSEANFDATKNFSYSWIMKLNSNTTNHGIVSKRVAASDTTHFAALLLQSTGGNLCFDFGGGQIRWGTNWTPTVNTWYHCACVYEASTTTMKFYLNGELRDSKVAESTFLSNTTNAPIYVGVLGGSLGYKFDGTIDEVAFFVDKALTTQELSTQYKSVFPIYWIYNGTKWTSGNRRIATTIAGETPVVDFTTYGTAAQTKLLDASEFTDDEPRTIYTVHTVANLPVGTPGSVESVVNYGYSALDDSTLNRHIQFRYNSYSTSVPFWTTFLRVSGGSGVGFVPANQIPTVGRYCSTWGYGAGERIFMFQQDGAKTETTVAGLRVPHEKLLHNTPATQMIRGGGLRTVIFRGEHTTEKATEIRAALLNSTPESI